MQDALIRILAEIDCIHQPLRENHWQNAPAWFERRRQFREAGIPWMPTDTAERTARMRMLQEFEDDGVLTVTRQKGRWPLVKLTARAYDRTREDCGLCSYSESLKLLDELLRLMQAGRGCYPGGNAYMVPETAVTGVPYETCRMTSRRCSVVVLWNHAQAFMAIHTTRRPPTDYCLHGNGKQTAPPRSMATGRLRRKPSTARHGSCMCRAGSKLNRFCSTRRPATRVI